jgi:hypothetical protein
MREGQQMMSIETRRFAAEFYYKPESITGAVQEWIDSGERREESDVYDDVIELAEALDKWLSVPRKTGS